MNSFGERPKSWIADHTPSTGPPHTETSWMESDTSTNAISFGFAATAILISLFLIMAIFEHLIRPRAFFSRSHNNGRRSLDLRQPQSQIHMHSLGKLKIPPPGRAPCQSDYSVLMPGQQCPTYIAQPAPLPCQRESIYWPAHDPHAFASP